MSTPDDAVVEHIVAKMIELDDVADGHLTQRAIEAVDPELVTFWIA